MKDIFDSIKWLSRFFGILCLTALVLFVSSFLTGGTNEIHKVASDFVNTFDVSYNKIDDFKATYKERARIIVENNVPTVSSLKGRYALVLDNPSVNYDGLNSPFYFRSESDKPEYYEIFPLSILKFNHPNVGEVIKFYKNDYESNAQIVFPDFDFFFTKLIEEFKRHSNSPYQNISVEYQVETSPTQKLTVRMDTISHTGVVININSYNDIYSKLLKRNATKTHRFSMSIPYKQIPIEGASLKNFIEFLKNLKVPYNYDYGATLSIINSNGDKIEPFLSKSLFELVQETKPQKGVSTDVAVGPIAVNSNVFFLVLPLLTSVIVFAQWLLTHNVMKKLNFSDTEDNSVVFKNWASHYFPFSIGSSSQSELTRLMLYYFLLPLVVILLLTYSKYEILPKYAYFFYVILTVSNLFFCRKIMLLLKSVGKFT